MLREAHGKGGSRSLHEQLAVGSGVDVSGPFDSFPLAPEEGRTVLVAGGIGITPLLSMAHALNARGQPFELHYLVRSEERLVLLDELRALPHAQVTVHVSERQGRADPAAILGRYQDGAQCYACGPVALLQALERAAAEQGWPGDAVHVESFGARAQDGDQPLTVELTLSEITLTVAPGTSILDALIEADVFVSYECKRGECGSCFAQVSDGMPLHRDVCLTGPQRAQGMCTCVSWAGSERLVLEL
ncbi:PDR/VanB family oxidoreductase [Rugamonas sp.]|uniref:PDR/VanB family oxidoreductase n=1 Tax=Rugamonas sp. TaxID=1926287 RepID=UPI0025F7B18F|nr:PDR/VanB family oxidoreductase [Rugamonas sp.]